MGCGQPGQTTGDFHLSATDGRGVIRDFEVLVPQPYNPSVPLALTFVFHGSGGDESAAKASRIQDAPGASAESVFIFPRGVDWESHGVGWDDSCSGYDMVFFDRMVAAITSRYCIDVHRIYVAGFSWGCDFVTALTCCRGDQLRAVAAASCSDEFSDPSNHRTYNNYACPTASAAGIRFTHDSSSQGDGPYSAAQFAATARLYADLNACSAKTVASTPAPCRAYANCAHPLIECAYAGLGHAPPDTWARDTWTFFSSFR